MHSSTSSSSERLPDAGRPRMWVAVLLVCIVTTGGWEFYVREKGLGDTAVADTAELWVRERERASVLGDDAVILVGASRIQMALDLQVMREYTTGTPVQLAMAAAPFLPVLEHLSNDDTITGTVIVSFTTQDLLWFARETRAERWVVAYDDYKQGKTAVFYQPFEDMLRTGVDSLLVSFEKGARPQQLIFGSTIRSYIRTLPDRSQQGDYSRVDRDAAYRRRVELVIGAEEPVFKEIPDFEERLAALETMADRIRARGGRVVFVRLPSSKRILEIEEIRYPRSVYWDVFAARTRSPVIHYADHPELSGFDLPDGVHIDVKDQPALTRALSALIFGARDKPQ